MHRGVEGRKVCVFEIKTQLKQILCKVHPPCFVIVVTCAGLFGWTDEKWIGYVLLLGLLIGVCGFVGLNYCIKYLSPLICSTVLLADAPVTGVLAWWSGLEGIP